MSNNKGKNIKQKVLKERYYFVKEWWPKSIKKESSHLKSDMFFDVESKDINQWVFGKLYKLEILEGGIRWIVEIPQQAVIKLNGEVYFADLKGEPILDKVNIFTVLDFTKKGVKPKIKRVKVKPIYIKEIGSKVRLVFDDKGSIYFLQNARIASISKEKYGYVGIKYGKTKPVVGKSFTYNSIVSYIFGNGCKRIIEPISIKKVTYVKEIGKNCFAIEGIIERKDSKTKKSNLETILAFVLLIPNYI